MKYKFWKLPVFKDSRGRLCPLEWKDFPFKPKRIYFLFGVKGVRGGHAHKKEKEIFICVNGSFRARTHDGRRWKTCNMKSPGQALYTSNYVWHEFDHFTPGAVMLAVSSTKYDGRKGYIMDFEEFLYLCKKRSS